MLVRDHDRTSFRQCILDTVEPFFVEAAREIPGPKLAPWRRINNYCSVRVYDLISREHRSMPVETDAAQKKRGGNHRITHDGRRAVGVS